MFNNSTIFIGIDLGDKHSFITILDSEGEVVEETRLPTTRTAFQRKFSSIPACRIAMEVGTHSRWVSHLLKDLGHDVLVANARTLLINHVRGIVKSSGARLPSCSADCFAQKVTPIFLRRSVQR